MSGMEAPAIMALASTAMAGGSMLAPNPTAKKVLGVGSALSGLGGMAAAPSAAAGATTAAKAVEQIPEAVSAGTDLAYGGSGAIPGLSMTDRISDVIKSGNIPGTKIPLSVGLGIGSLLAPGRTARNVLGGAGVGLGLAGAGMNAYDRLRRVSAFR